MSGYQGENVVICTGNLCDNFTASSSSTIVITPPVEPEPAEPESKTPIPEWISTASDVAAKLFGVEHWSIYIRMVPQAELRAQSPHDLEDDDEIGGNTDTNPRYFFAKIGLHADIEQDEDGYETIAHEFFHVAQSQLLQNAERMIELCATADQAHAAALFADGNEQAATIIGRIAGPIIQKRTEKKLARNSPNKLNTFVA